MKREIGSLISWQLESVMLVRVKKEPPLSALLPKRSGFLILPPILHIRFAIRYTQGQCGTCDSIDYMLYQIY